jgi:hypothetical protein
VLLTPGFDRRIFRLKSRFLSVSGGLAFSGEDWTRRRSAAFVLRRSPYKEATGRPWRGDPASAGPGEASRRDTMLTTAIISLMTHEIKFDPVAWTNWEQRFLREEEEAYRNAPAEEPTKEIPKHELMSAEEVCAQKRWSLSTLRRNTRSRKLSYIRRDGRVWFRRADVEAYDQKRYIPSK